MLLCFHCCHKINNNQLGLPINYNPQNNEYKTIYNFCSWSCMKGFIIYSNMSSKRNMITSMVHLRHSMTGKMNEIISAPPRECLKVFGGTMDIDEFKNTNNDYIITYPPITHINPSIEKSIKYNLGIVIQMKIEINKAP